MLSPRNFQLKHKKRFDRLGLTKTERSQRYTAYVAQNSSNKNKNITPNTAVKAKNKNTNKNRTPRQTNRPYSNTVKLSDCLMLYAKASIDPFVNIQQMPCIPDTISAPSFKYKTFIDASFTVGTLGTGYAAFNPWAMAINNGGFNGTESDYPIIVTTGTYPLVDYANNATAVTSGYTIGLDSNSFYDYNTISEGALRLVSAGLELEYMGQLLNQAGAISVIQWDGLQTIPDQTISSIRSNQRTQTCAVSKDSRCYVRYEPVLTQNFDYLNIDAYLPTHNSTQPPFYYPLLCIVNGATAGTQFRIRAVAYFELQLSKAPSSPSDSDPIGFSAFQSARSMVLPSPDPKADLISIINKTGQNIIKTVSGLAPGVGTALGAALGNPAAGLTAGTFTKDVINALFQ